jgi:hypothetical protein
MIGSNLLEDVEPLLLRHPTILLQIGKLKSVAFHLVLYQASVAPPSASR